MKRTIWTTLAVLALLGTISSCAPTTTATPIPTVDLDTSSKLTSGNPKASAEVVPAHKARLSFVISGMVKEVNVKEGDQVQEGQVLVTLDTTEQEFDIVAAEAALKAAEIDAARQRIRRKFTRDNGKVIYLTGPREKILIVDSIVEQKKAALEIAKAEMLQGTILAPFDATVVTVNVKPGEYVQTSQVVIEMADLNKLQIETTDLSELNVAAVKIGQPATVFVESLNENFPGKVTAISPIADTIGGDVVFKVTIKLDKQPEELLWGMSADVEINTQ